MTSSIYKSKTDKTENKSEFYSFNYKNLLIITDHMKACKLSLSQKIKSLSEQLHQRISLGYPMVIAPVSS